MASNTNANHLSYHVFGDLYLPDPLFSVSGSKVRRLQELRPILNEFEHREPTTPSFDLTESFKVFQEKESEIWDGKRDKRLMVKPSGSPLAKIAMHLHYPTNRTKKLYNGETADRSSPCTNMVITVGFSDENAFFWDSHPWREDAPFEPRKAYTREVLASHHKWESLLRRHLYSKVEVVWGKPGEISIKSEFKEVLEEMVLWDDQETTLYLHFTSPAKIFLQRIIIFVPHPQSLYYNYTIEEAVRMDWKLKVAADLARVARTEKQETYFVWRSLDRDRREEERLANGQEKIIKKRKQSPTEDDPNKPRKYRGTQKTAKSDPYLIFPPNITVEISCSKCSLTMVDEKPAFWKTDRRFYVIHNKCYCKGCAPEKDTKVLELPTSDIPWMRSDLQYLTKKPDAIIKLYNKWAATQANRSQVLTETELLEMELEKEEEARDIRENGWERSENDEYLEDYLYLDERDFVDEELEELARQDRWLFELDLGPFVYWGPVVDRIKS